MKLVPGACEVTYKHIRSSPFVWIGIIDRMFFDVSGAQLSQSNPTCRIGGTLQKLKSAENQDDMAAMTFEEDNRKLGNYYAAKGRKCTTL